jgi:hypothetical protein
VRVILNADGRQSVGGTPLVQHNERLSDPIDNVKRALGKITSKRGKVDTDHEKAAWVEFVGGLYTNPVIEINDKLEVIGNGHRVIVPASNILRCLQDGATRFRRGKDVLRGVLMVDEFALLEARNLNGQTPKELYAQGFGLRKGVVVQRQRIMRTRPIFEDWKITLAVEVDETIFDFDVLTQCWEAAGRYCGLGDMRPTHGRFTGTIQEVR